jgi:hypothetical protein
MHHTTREQGESHFHSTANCQVRTDPPTLLLVCLFAPLPCGHPACLQPGQRPQPPLLLALRVSRHAVSVWVTGLSCWPWLPVRAAGRARLLGAQPHPAATHRDPTPAQPATHDHTDMAVIPSIPVVGQRLTSEQGGSSSHHGGIERVAA